MTGSPPSTAGGNQLRLAIRFPRTAVTSGGASGFVAGVTELLGELRIDCPTALRAATENRTGSPFVNPVTEHELFAVVHTTLPLRSLTV